MKTIATALLLSAAGAITLRKEALSQMPTGQETLCALRKDGKLNLEDTFFSRGGAFKEHRDGGFNTQALAQAEPEGEGPKLTESDFERHLQQNMGNNAGLVYNAKL